MQLRALSLASCLAVSTVLAQTTGVPGINDYTVNNLGSGSTSCAALCFPNGGVTLNFVVSAPPGAVALVLFNFCPCQTCSLGGPTNACLPAIPLTACGPSNQSLDIDLTAACGITFSAFLTPNTAGMLALSLPIPTFGGAPCTNATLSTQAVVIDPCGLGLFAVPGPFVMTQSYTLTF